MRFRFLRSNNLGRKNTELDERNKQISKVRRRMPSQTLLEKPEDFDKSRLAARKGHVYLATGYERSGAGSQRAGSKSCLLCRLPPRSSQYAIDSGGNAKYKRGDPNSSYRNAQRSSSIYQRELQCCSSDAGEKCRNGGKALQAPNGVLLRRANGRDS